ncbi:Aerobic glycerol-3-phosphate dehydrogenase [Labilithrix luteola]|uniref:Aerobic glycerol-3-phosphate dehydrogenase n=1 Tax=Labilithrix luteola TaxID=1391654 RepID=A0A0K1QFY2_9BACT|nr:glycerol-3-phosphate dehydrogenase/oxidase [Labilithrix luteola]AKV04633.1 Aerobic glycerol-3-phosphate dehydrogenase [Labilithrix luteola]
MWTRGYRDEVWSRLDQPWDLIIIGGGITGAGILSEAARHGKKALLVEAQDFASGTSSRSTKLVHGGLRYLRQGQFLVTRKSVRERERLMQEGRGLVDPLAFSLAAFPGDQMPKWMYGVGLAMYDALAWKWAHEAQSKDEIIARIPPLGSSNVQGGYRYFDAQTDDARLTLRVIQEGVRHGGTAINYARADQLLRTADGRVRGIVLRDMAPGATRTAEVQAKVVISATGAWADDLRTQLGHEKRLRKIRGSHITFAASRLPLKEAVSLLHPRDQRAIFAIPWEGVTIFGTTDVDHGDLNTEPAISQQETEYLLEALQKAFPSLELGARDIISTWAGVRPVINTGKSDPSKESREHAIWREDGLLTISGGKLTTFVVMARDALAAVQDDLGELGPRTQIFDTAPAEVNWPSSVDEGERIRLLGRFGTLIEAVAADKEGAERIGGSVALYSELRHAARSEAVVTMADLLLRRVRLGLLLPNGGFDQMARIRAVAQPELGWDDAHWEREEAAYRKLWKQAYSSPI